MSLFIELKTALFRVRQALVGLEYLQINEVMMYNCSLCSKQGNLETIISHLQSEGHHLEFLKSHFPSVIQAIQLECFENRPQKLAQLLEKLCSEVEIRLGRLAPTFLTGDDTFDTEQRSQIEHFKEDPSSTLVIDLILMINAAQKHEQRSRSPLGALGSHERSSSRHDSGLVRRLNIDYETDYLLKSHRIRRQYLEYYHDLNSHPGYEEAWNSFWKKNSRKYRADKKDPIGSDFTKHWKHFWDHRLAVLEEEDVLKVRVSLRNRFHLAVEPRDQTIYERLVNDSKKRPAESPSRHNSAGHSSPREVELRSSVKKKKVSTPVTTKAKIPQQMSESTSNSGEACGPKPSGGENDDLSNEELVFLFSNYRNLYENEKRVLKAFMESLKETDTERFEVIESFTRGAMG